MLTIHRQEAGVSEMVLFNLKLGERVVALIYVEPVSSEATFVWPLAGNMVLRGLIGTYLKGFVQRSPTGEPVRLEFWANGELETWDLRTSEFVDPAALNGHVLDLLGQSRQKERAVELLQLSDEHSLLEVAFDPSQHPARAAVVLRSVPLLSLFTLMAKSHLDRRVRKYLSQTGGQETATRTERALATASVETR